MPRIGLEIHVQLTTASKLFCSCPTAFTREPNTSVCEICLGFPGSKPVINAKAVEYALKIGLALNCNFPPESAFSRKSYFYPDMSKNYQITQYESPIAANGWLQLGPKRIRISRINLEEDPARITHVGPVPGAKYILVDYNRSGVPLCEIVTEPDFSTPAEARTFLQELSSILEYLGVYDSSIEGSMRIDSNISVSETRVEVKNISGFKEVERALNYEIVRQRDALRRGEKLVRETRAWDANRGITYSMRMKEEEVEYGYIFDTDLPIITISKQVLDKIRSTLPEFAHQKTERYVRQLGINRELALAITSEPDLAEAFEQVIKEIPPTRAAPFFAGEIKKSLNWHNLKLRQTGLKPSHIITLLQMIESKEITERSAELMLRDLILHPQDPRDMLRRGFGRIYDEAVIEKLVEDVLAANPRAVIDFRSGTRPEAFEFLIGQVMRASQGRADPMIVREILQKRLKML